MLVVIDTNVLVSAFWSRNGNPARILGMVLSGSLKACYDFRILEEYRNVLLRSKFGFSGDEVEAVLRTIEDNGYSVVADTVGIPFTDESDRKFYEVAKYCGAKLITGNVKHFPQEPDIMPPAEFLALLPRINEG